MKSFSELISSSLIGGGCYIREQTTIAIIKTMKTNAKSVFGVWIDFSFI